MKTTDEIKKLNGFEYNSEISKIILFNNDSEYEYTDFLKWNKMELLTFYNEWKSYDTYNDPIFFDQLTMKSSKHRMRLVVNNILYQMIRQVVSNNTRISNISRKDILDYVSTKRREIIINELIN